MSSPRTALRERVAALGRARRAVSAGRLDDAERILREELERWPGNRDAQALLADVTRAAGRTPGHQPVPGPAPKQAGEAWSSFEQRIRDRRSRRLHEHIRESLDAGSPEAALEALEELETIAPGVPLPDDIAERLAAQEPRPLARAAVSEPKATRPFSGPTSAVSASGEPSARETRPPAVIETPSTRPLAGPTSAVPASKAAPAFEARPSESGVPQEDRSTSGATESSLDTWSTFASPAVIDLETVTEPHSDSGSALDLFPAASAADESAAEAGRVRLDDWRVRDHDSALRLELADTPQVAGTARSRNDAVETPSPPMRERGAHLVGLVLLVSSIVALSGWAGYRLFKPVASVTEVPAVETERDTPAAGAPEASAPVTPETTAGTAGGAGETAPPLTTTPVPDSGSAATPSASGSTPAPSLPAPSPDPAAGRPQDAASRDAAPQTGSAPEQRPQPAAEAPPAVSTQAQEAPLPSPPVPTATANQGPAASGPPPAPVEPVAPVTPGNAAPSPETAPPSAPPADTNDGKTPATATADSSSTGDEASAQDAAALRGLIEGYLAGYNNLDAGGVRSVWPSVDYRALSRAFGQLRSQHLSFSRCVVRASGDVGHGFCTGHASWRPRVGGGERIEQRVWRFDFGQQGDRWSIERVAVER